jgi:acyl-CoA thioesterase-1
MVLSNPVCFVMPGAVKVGMALFLAAALLAGCDRASETPSPSGSRPAGPDLPRDGMGVRLGKDVTGQPGRRTGATVDVRPVIVAFGDSLTAGFGVPPEESYPAQLQRRLDEAGYPYRVLNAGVSGETSAGGLRRVEWVVKSHPRIVILEFGGNDGLRGLDLKHTKANIEAMVVRFQQAGVTVVLAGMQLPPNYGRDYTDQFAQLYAELAKTHGVTLIPFFLDGVAARPELNQADGFHPTGTGYRIIADNVMKALRSILGGDSAAQQARES